MSYDVELCKCQHELEQEKKKTKTLEGIINKKTKINMQDFASELFNNKEDNKLEILKDKVDHITSLVDLEWNGQITRTELVRRLTDIVKK